MLTSTIDLFRSPSMGVSLPSAIVGDCRVLEKRFGDPNIISVKLKRRVLGRISLKDLMKSLASVLKY